MNTSPRTSRAPRWLAMVGILLVVAACSGAATERSATATQASTPTQALAPTSTLAPTSSATSATSIGSGDSPLAPGRYAARVFGTGSYPRWTVAVPDGWYEVGNSFVVKYPHTDKHGPVLGISVWDVGQVFRDPCHWQGQAVDPGPGVEALVTALAAQPMRNASKPTDVTLAGYQGRYLDWSVPANMKSSTWTDFDACDVDSDGHRDFNSWLGNGEGNRYQQVPGQVDRLWVLHVNGQRMVVDATYSPDTPQADRVELGHVVESLRFVTP